MPSPNDQQLAERMADLTYRLLENCTEKQEYIAEKFALSLSEFRCLRSVQSDKTLCVKDIAQRWLDWKVLGPMVAKHRALIEAEVMRDTKKLTTNEQFTSSIDGETASLKAFADQRRTFLLK